MAITTYDELKTALENWSHRTDLTAVIPDFIALCEADFNRRLRIAQMETRSSVTLDEEYEDLPTDFLELRQIIIEGSPNRVLSYLTPTQMNEKYGTVSAGTPYHFTIVGSQFKFETIPASVTATLYYYAKIAALSDSNTTNWMLTNHPDVYLYGSLAMAEPYIKNDKRFPLWKNQYDQALQQVSDTDKHYRWTGPLMMQVESRP